MEAALDRLDAEAPGADRRLGVARRAAAAERLRPEEAIGASLHTAKDDVAGADVLPEAKLAAGSQHASQLGERSCGVGHRAEDTHHDRRVERLVRGVERDGHAGDDVDRRGGRLRPRLRSGARGRVGLDGKDVLDLGRVVLEGAPVPGADLEHAPAEAREQACAKLALDGIGTASLPPLEESGEAGLLGPVERRLRAHGPSLCRSGDTVRAVTNVLVTGMSGTGKSTALIELGRRGFRVVDTDAPAWSEWTAATDEWVWREDRIARLLAEQGGGTLFVSGCRSNQGRFYDRFDAVVLLSAPAAVILDRIAARTTNDFGKGPGERERILGDLEAVEPLLRATCTHELDATRPLAEVVDALVAIGREAES